MRGQPAGVLFRPWLPWLLGIKMSNLLPVPAAARLSPIHTAGLALAQPAFGFGIQCSQRSSALCWTSKFPGANRQPAPRWCCRPICSIQCPETEALHCHRTKRQKSESQCALIWKMFKRSNGHIHLISIANSAFGHQGRKTLSPKQFQAKKRTLPASLCNSSTVRTRITTHKKTTNSILIFDSELPR